LLCLATGEHTKLLNNNERRREMNLLLQTPDSNGELSQCYGRAFTRGVELFIVTAFLTDWDTSLRLNPDCRHFRMIVGRDFGITRKAACKAVMRWLPPEQKFQFMVADLISGFHPKAVFWKEPNGKCFSIIGSSNLTQAAFETNYEANAISQISDTEYAAVKEWVKNIEKHAVPVDANWLRKYKEADTGGIRGKKNAKSRNDATPSDGLELPKPKGAKKQIRIRREKLDAYAKKRKGLIGLFRRCADRQVSSAQFYEQLPQHWSNALGDRLQGTGWEIHGKKADFQALSKSYLKILDATDEDRDDIVAEEIDALRKQRVPTRRAFLSEMLCLEFPEEYPVLNTPVEDYLRAVNYKFVRGASEGSGYIELAKKLRYSLLHNPGHPAKNLAELDTVIWLEQKVSRGGKRKL
jgi:HKD family nuclease